MATNGERCATDSRRPKRKKLFWAEGPESRRLETRTLLTLTVTSFPIPLVGLVEPDGITTGPDGNLWFTETGAARIGRMTPAGALTEFPLPPVAVPPGSTDYVPGPTDITAGPDGALWFTGIPGEIGRITTAGAVTEFAVPLVPPPAGSPAGTASTPATLVGITAGPDGALWFGGVPGEVGRITTAGVVNEFAVPAVPPPAGSPAETANTVVTPSSITVGPDGALWFIGAPGAVGRITTTGVVSEFAVPLVPPASGSPAGTASTLASLTSITAGPDGALWFMSDSGTVGRITTAGIVSELTVPVSPSSGGTSLPQPNVIVSGPDGNLWCFASDGFGAGAEICRITPAGAFTFFNVTGNFNSIAGLTSGPDGNLWFTEQEDGSSRGQQPALGEITPAGITNVYALAQGTTLDPNRGVAADMTLIATGPDGALWFGENGAMGRITTAGAIQQFPLPTLTATPENIAPGPDGAVWFTQKSGVDGPFSIGRITTAGAITIYPLSPNSTSAFVTAGPGGIAWFSENLFNQESSKSTAAIGRITPEGKIQTFYLPQKVPRAAHLGNITLGPDGNLWFSVSYLRKSSHAPQAAIGRITARGKVKMYHVVTTGNKPYGSYPPSPPSDLISGPDGKLWFNGTVNGITGIARISTSGKFAPVIPVADNFSNMVRLPNGQVWFENGANGILDTTGALGIATRSGIVATTDLPESSPYLGGYGASRPSMTLGSDGNLWATNGVSSIVRISGIDAIEGGLDYRNRPKHAPDFVYDSWTNVSGSAKPMFAGVARPGAEVSLWVQKQGESQPVAIGQVHANINNGSWTLKSDLKLSDGSYAVTASQTGDTGPAIVLYSLKQDASGDLSSALVIDTKRLKKMAGA